MASPRFGPSYLQVTFVTCSFNSSKLLYSSVARQNYLACGGFCEPEAIGIPPSGAGTCGTAADAYVPTSPSIRMEILIMRFMGFLLPRR
jgi:hypothetical protein